MGALSGILNELPITRIKIGIAKVLYRFTRLFVWSNTRTITRSGIRYEIDLSEGVDLSLFWFGGFQNYVTNNNLIKIKKDAVVLDVGGNCGIMSLQFAKAARAGQVYAFEPTHYAFAKFKKNLSLNPELAARIQLFNAFVSDHASAAPDIKAFSSWKVDGGRRTDEAVHPIHLGTPKSTEGVPSIRLDDFVEEKGLATVDIIKIDTDGHELKILQGARQCVAKHRPAIIFEVGQYLMKERGIVFGMYCDFFGELGYRVFDAGAQREIGVSNYAAVIPKLGTIDAIALPLARRRTR